MLEKTGDNVMEEREVPGCKAEVTVWAGGWSGNVRPVNRYQRIWLPGMEGSLLSKGFETEGFSYLLCDSIQCTGIE